MTTPGVMTPSIPSAEVAMKLALVGKSSFTLASPLLCIHYIIHM